MMEWLLDALLVTGLLGLGWFTVASPQLFRAIVWFIALGLFMALCWARLAAPDLALAEAALGAGLTGALLLGAYQAVPAAHENISGPATRATLAVLVLAAIGLAGGLIWAVLNLPPAAPDLRPLVHAELGNSGVSNPVTAVLLNFRGYDTLLEMAVLLLAVLGVWVVSADATTEQAPAPVDPNTPLTALTRVLIPLAVLVAGYLLWAGAHSPGGAFQAGAVLAAAGVLLRLSDQLQPLSAAPAGQLFLLVLGLSVFSAIALAMLFLEGALLQYPRSWAGPLILAIESALALSIALTLTLLFSRSRGLARNWP